MNGIQYTRIDNYCLMELFQDIEKNQQYLVPAAKSIYDHVVYDSDIERQFAEGLENRKDVKLYVKLPSWFKVPTSFSNLPNFPVSQPPFQGPA